MHTIETINYIIMCLFFVCYAYQFAYIPLAWLPHENGKHRNRIRITHLQF